MIGLEVNDAVVLEQQKVLEQALSSNPKTQKALQKLIRKALIQARAEVSESIKFKNGDPRESAKAVRTSVYKNILGGNLNIYNSRKAHGATSYTPPRKGISGRGGNRRIRTERTRKIMSYAPLDRGFILRWLNAGVNDRSIEFTERLGRKADKWNKHPNTGNRGSIAARNFFGSSGNRALNRAVENLATMIDTELEAMLNKK